MNRHHTAILRLIKAHSGKATSHTFSDNYLGNNHPRYAISAPVLRKLAREWMRSHRDLVADEFCDLLTSLIEGKSSTEKCTAGILLDYSRIGQREFDPGIFEHWLDHLEGWAEVDAVCTGDFTRTHILPNLKRWKPILSALVQSQNINKRRASLVLLCTPLRHDDDKRLAALAFKNVSTLRNEKDGLITKAVSWVLRSMVSLHRSTLEEYLARNADNLPRIAVRETTTKLRTGTKSGKRTGG